MNTVKLIAWLVLPLVGLVLLGMLAVSVFEAIWGVLFYLIVGGVVAGGGVYLYRRVKRELGPGTRTRMRIDAASQTYRERNR